MQTLVAGNARFVGSRLSREEGLIKLVMRKSELLAISCSNW
jgi:hypothetical protein